MNINYIVSFHYSKICVTQNLPFLHFFNHPKTCLEGKGKGGKKGEQEGKEGRKEGKRNRDQIATHPMPSDWESKPKPFGVWDDASTN